MTSREEETQRLVEGSARLTEFPRPRRAVLIAVVVGVALAALAAAVVTAVLFGRPGTAPDEGIPVLAWSDCAQWLNGTEGGFALPEDGRPYDACAQLSFCLAGPSRFGYRALGESACLSPGPTLRMRVGARYGLVLCVDDNVGMATNLHTHGLHLPGTGNGDDVTREVRPGECIFYQYELPEEHMGGLHWYHAHMHGITRAQVAGGAFGLIVVEEQPRAQVFASDSDSAALDGPWLLLTAPDRERLLVAAYDPVAQRWGNAQSPNRTFALRRGQWYRFRLLAQSVLGVASPLALPPGCDCARLANDGVYLFRVPQPLEEGGSVLLTGASRLDLAVRCNASSLFRMGADVVGVLAVDDEQRVEGRASPYAGDGQQQWDSFRPLYLADLRSLPCDGCQEFSVRISPSTVNGVSFDAFCPFKTADGGNWQFGQLNEWTLNNSGPHPFHLHLYHQQVVGSCGDGHASGEYFDTIAATGDGGAACVVRFVTRTHAARVMLHCHVLAHEDAGAMGWIHVVPSEDTRYDTEPCCQLGRPCATPCVAIPADDCNHTAMTMPFRV